MAWIGDWNGSRHEDSREHVSGYNAFFEIHLQMIDRQNGQCGSFRQVIKDLYDNIDSGSCRSNLTSCQLLRSIETKTGGLTANVEPSAGCGYIGSYMGIKIVSLKVVVNNTNQIKVTLRDKNDQSIDDFFAIGHGRAIHRQDHVSWFHARLFSSQTGCDTVYFG